ncbi:hypothetical protein Bca52824_007004 [Brassica carinata]|uniref:Uncharacterized protein n=1 Tax=Brassica carinata TaxID=52824 RepID=A0A8X7W680_BRACI|nr:hypothetical protein Bca52824_007004 [Brassica carinata]
MDDDIYPYISWTGNYTVCESLQFSRRDEVEDDRVKLLMQMIMKQFDFSEGEKEKVATHEGEGGSDEEPNDKDGEGGSDEASGSDEEFQTPKGSATIRARDTKGKKGLPDRGMEKRKHKFLHTRPQQAFDEDMKTFVTQLFQQGFAAMEERLEKKMDEKFEGVRKALKDFLKPRDALDFDPSQTNNDNDASGSKQSNAPLTSAKWDRWTGGPSKKLQLSDSPMAADGSPQRPSYYFTEESWDRFTKWST